MFEREDAWRPRCHLVPPACVLYCVECEFDQIIMKLCLTNCRVSFIDFYSVFPTSGTVLWPVSQSVGYLCFKQHFVSLIKNKSSEVDLRLPSFS